MLWHWASKGQFFQPRFGQMMQPYLLLAVPLIFLGYASSNLSSGRYKLYSGLWKRLPLSPKLFRTLLRTHV